MNQQLSLEITRLKNTFDTAELFAENMRRLLTSHPNMIRDSSLGGINRPFFISFQTFKLARCSIQPQNAKQVDTIMSMGHTQYLQGGVSIFGHTQYLQGGVSIFDLY